MSFAGTAFVWLAEALFDIAVELTDFGIRRARCWRMRRERRRVLRALPVAPWPGGRGALQLRIAFIELEAPARRWVRDLERQETLGGWPRDLGEATMQRAADALEVAERYGDDLEAVAVTLDTTAPELRAALEWEPPEVRGPEDLGEMRAHALAILGIGLRARRATALPAGTPYRTEA